MGLFDGISKEQDSEMVRDFASTAHIARLLDLPVVLVIDCSKLSGSVAAIAHGYCTLDSRLKIAGVVLNRVGSDRHLTLLQEALEPLNLPVLGVLRRTEEIAIPDRHLGLVPTAELHIIEELTSRLAEIAATSFDWEKLLPLLKREEKRRCGDAETPGNQGPSLSPRPPISPSSSVRIAWAWDRAFSFYYQDNLDLLEQLGAQLIPWSPLEDPCLPEKTQGIYLGGGFPEVFAEELANNYSGLKAVKKAIAQLTPTYAECGGLMYLCEQIIDFNQVAWSMVGILPTKAVMSSRLTLGYRKAIALKNSSLLETGQVICGHEFHRSQLTTAPQNPLLQTHNYSHTREKYYQGWQPGQLHASYLHVHFAQYQDYLERFLGCCKRCH
jgi:cobyrinic acid a,c-diamide synthase